jgi:succinoglycan biosynthesis protein ExoO
MQPDVSVIIAAYNAGATLADAIESALAQREVAVEVVVVNDASLDDTAAVARDFASEGVRLVDLPENRGPGGARNAGLEAATGRWISVLDADDTMLPGRLGRMLARASGPAAQVVVDNLIVQDVFTGEAKAMFDRSFLAGLGEISLADFIRSNRIFVAKYNFGYMKPLFARSFLQAHGLRYDEALRIGEDYLFMASALARGARCAVVPEPGYVYKVRGGSISGVLDVRHVRAMLASDDRFERAHQLDAAARQAMRERRRNLRQAASFLRLVQQFKEKALLGAAATAIRDPVALRHLRMPIGVRLRRLAAFQ